MSHRQNITKNKSFQLVNYKIQILYNGEISHSTINEIWISLFLCKQYDKSENVISLTRTSLPDTYAFSIYKNWPYYFENDMENSVCCLHRLIICINMWYIICCIILYVTCVMHIIIICVACMMHTPEYIKLAEIKIEYII